MTSRVTDVIEFTDCVNSKATGEKDDGYLAAMKHQEDTIRAGLISNMPLSISYDALLPSGLPEVNKLCKNLLYNLQESVKPTPKTPAFMRSLNKLIAEGLVKRIPATVKKENDEIPGRIGYHRVYLYVDRDYSCPDWWPRRLNEPGKLSQISFKSYSRRIIPGVERSLGDNNASESIARPVRVTQTAKIIGILPTSPSPDLVVDPISTPGTLNYITQQLGIDSTLINRRKISSLLNVAMKKGNVGRVYRNSTNGIQGHNKISIYYKLV